LVGQQPEIGSALSCQRMLAFLLFLVSSLVFFVWFRAAD